MPDRPIDLFWFLAERLVLSEFGVIFLIVTAVLAALWARFRRGAMSARPGTAAAIQRFLAAWIILTGLGAAAAAVWLMNTATHVVETWKGIDGCVNC